MAPTEAEIKAAAKAMLRERSAQMGEGWGEPHEATAEDPAR